MNLSVDEANPAERVRRIKVATADVKNRITAGLQYLTQSYFMPLLSLWMCREIAHNILATHTVVGCASLGGDVPLYQHKRPRKRVQHYLPLKCHLSALVSTHLGAPEHSRREVSIAAAA